MRFAEINYDSQLSNRTLPPKKSSGSQGVCWYCCRRHEVLLFVIVLLTMAFSRLVFVSYTHEDRERVHPDVELLD
jgi:hypothetical protein